MKNIKFANGSDLNWPGKNATGEFTLYGDREKTIEKVTTVINFPGGHVEISRTSNNQYWVHVGITHPENKWGAQAGKLIDARIDVINKNADKHRAAPLLQSDIDHVAFLIGKN